MSYKILDLRGVTYADIIRPVKVEVETVEHVISETIREVSKNEKWPMNKNFHCWECSCHIPGRLITIPSSYNADKWKFDGYFCSFTCAFMFTRREHSNSFEREMLLRKLYKFLEAAEIAVVHPSPISKYRLRKFEGSSGISEHDFTDRMLLNDRLFSER